MIAETGSNVNGRERIAAAFARAKTAGRCALIPYVCAGDPNRATTAALLARLGAAGADIVELGVPYGDPLADGPTIAAAAQRALASGTTLEDVFELVAGARFPGSPPIVLFAYFNLVMQFGLERFAAALAAAGGCGAIVPDVPLEETDGLRGVFAPRGLALPLLIAPTTPPRRAEAIALASTGFTYVVSRVGVTGAAHGPDFRWTGERVATLRLVSDLPVAIGFGISSAAHVRDACEVADGAIVGSALIDAFSGTVGDEAVARACAFMHELQGGTRG